MKLKYMCLDCPLDLWPPSHFKIGFFASRIERSVMECAAWAFLMYVVRNGQLAKMSSFQHSKWSDKKRYMWRSEFS